MKVTPKTKKQHEENMKATWSKHGVNVEETWMQRKDYIKKHGAT